MTSDEVGAIRELAAAIHVLAEALIPKIGGTGSFITVRHECDCKRPSYYGSYTVVRGAGAGGGGGGSQGT
jgi:hypothetical protein